MVLVKTFKVKLFTFYNIITTKLNVISYLIFNVNVRTWSVLEVPVAVDGPAAERGPHWVRVRYPYNPRLIIVWPKHLSPVAILRRQETKLPTWGQVCYPYNPCLIVVRPEHLSPVAILGRQKTKLPTRGWGLLPVLPSPHHSAARTHQAHCDPWETNDMRGFCYPFHEPLPHR